MEKKIDMHIHTTVSDGTDSPAQVVEKAAALGLSAIAITDHDRVDGVLPAQQTGERLGLEVVGGIEISADYQGNKAHVLGLFIDPGSEALRPALDWAANERAQRNEKIVAAMQADGFDISMAVLRAAYPDSLLGRPHMAEYLMKKGYVTTVREAFDRFLGEGCPYYRNKERIPMDDAAELIRRAGGVAVLAHPLQYGYTGAALETFLERAKAVGCAALEAYYSEHSPAEQAFLLKAAMRLKMGVSGGSDYHGTRKPHICLGSGIENGLYVPETVLAGLKALREKQ